MVWLWWVLQQVKRSKSMLWLCWVLQQVAFTRSQGDFCNQPPDSGPCTQSLSRYAYNPTLKRCTSFVYGGCKGNMNRFLTDEECVEACGLNTAQSEGTSSPVNNSIASTSPFSTATAASVSPSSSVTPATVGGSSTASSPAPSEEQFFFGTLLDLDTVSNNTYSIDFESGPQNWTLSQMELVKISEVNHAAEPLSGVTGTIWRIFRSGEHHHVEIDFSLFLEGYSRNTSLGLNPAFRIRILDVLSKARVEVLSLRYLTVRPASWSKFRFSAPVSEEAKTINITFEMTAGPSNGAKILLDDIKIRLIPVLGRPKLPPGSYLFQPPSNESTTEPSTTTASQPTTSTTATSTTTTMVQESTANSSTASSSTTSTATSTHDTNTTTTTSAASINTTTVSAANVTTPSGSSTTVTSSNYTTTPTPASSNSTTSRNNATSTPFSTTPRTNSTGTTAATNSTTPGEGTVENLIAEQNKNDSRYGYAAEVVLICLVVVFGLSFILMFGKYLHLRRNINEYRVNNSRQTYDNPAYNGGFGMQASYRSH